MFIFERAERIYSVHVTVVVKDRSMTSRRCGCIRVLWYMQKVMGWCMCVCVQCVRCDNGTSVRAEAVANRDKELLEASGSDEAVSMCV